MESARKHPHRDGTYIALLPIQHRVRDFMCLLLHLLQQKIMRLMLLEPLSSFAIPFCEQVARSFELLLPYYGVIEILLMFQRTAAVFISDGICGFARFHHICDWFVIVVTVVTVVTVDILPHVIVERISAFNHRIAHNTRTCCKTSKIHSRSSLMDLIGVYAIYMLYYEIRCSSENNFHAFSFH